MRGCTSNSLLMNFKRVVPVGVTQVKQMDGQFNNFEHYDTYSQNFVLQHFMQSLPRQFVQSSDAYHAAHVLSGEIHRLKKNRKRPLETDEKQMAQKIPKMKLGDVAKQQSVIGIVSTPNTKQAKDTSHYERNMMIG